MVCKKRPASCLVYVEVVVRQLNKQIWPHTITVSKPSISYDIEDWLTLNCGPFRDRWYVVYHHDKTVYYFREPEHAFVFQLTWQ